MQSKSKTTAGSSVIGIQRPVCFRYEMKSLLLLAAVCCLVLSVVGGPVSRFEEKKAVARQAAPAAAPAPAASDDDDDDDDEDEDDDDVDLDEALTGMAHSFNFVLYFHHVF